MPYQDGTGPYGRGPVTGRGLGQCGGGLRRGFAGRGFAGRGFGWRYSEPIVLSKEEKKKILEAELKELEQEKEAVKRQLKEI